MKSMATALVLLLCSGLTAAGDPGTAIKRLAAAEKDTRKSAETELRGLGLAGAEAAAAAPVGDADFEARRARLTKPFAARLFWNTRIAKGIAPRLRGTISVDAFVLGRKAGTASLSLSEFREHGALRFRVRSEGQGRYRNDSGQFSIESLYDEGMQLINARISVLLKKKGKVTERIDQTWQRLGAGEGGEARFRVQKGDGKPSIHRLPAGVILPDLYTMLIRGLDIDSKKRERLQLSVLDPITPASRVATLDSIRRERTVAKGGVFIQALRMELQVPGMPKELGIPRLWMDADGKPVKARVTAITVYARSRFEASPPAPAATKSKSKPAAPRPADKPKNAKKKKFF